MWTPGHVARDFAQRLDVVHRVGGVLLEAGRDGEDVGVEDDVGRLDAGLFGEEPVGALADRDLPRLGVGLALLVEGHHDHAGAVAPDGGGLGEEVGFAFLQADRVDDALPLQALQAGLDHRPLGAVDHHRDPGHFGLGRDQVEERGHRLLGVEHALVHVDVEEVGAAAHLLEGDVDRAGVVAAGDQPGELLRAGDVGPLADHLEVGVGPDGQRLEAAELREPRQIRRPDPRRHAVHGARDGGDVVRGRAAAAAEDVDEAARREVAHQRRGLLRLLVVGAEGVRQAGVGVGRRPNSRRSPTARRCTAACPWPRARS